MMGTGKAFPYRDVELFYESPHSRIYKAWDQDNQLFVILKCFPVERHDVYLREMSAAFGVRHPNINQCLDAVYLQAQHIPCIVYEFIPGGNLREYLNRHLALSSQQVFSCLRDILSALRHIHELGFIHCDLKPENILLREMQDGRIRYVLSDLGAAASVREAKSGGHTMSSPAYVAPERLYDRFTPSSDMYSLGVVGYELATGQRPFAGDTRQIARAHLSETPDFARISHPYLREFIARLMDKQPQERSTAHQALDTLIQLQNGTVPEPLPVVASQRQPVAAPPVIRCPPQAETLKLYFQTQLTYRPDKLLIFHLERQAVMVLGRDNHVVLSKPPQEQPLAMMANANPLKAQSSDCLAYAIRDSVFLLDLRTQQHRCLYDSAPGLTAFDVRDEYVVWSDAENGHIYHRGLDSHYTYRNPVYLMRPVLHLLADGRFAGSEGYMNHELVIRDAETRREAVWTLDGPIVLCQAMEQEQVLLVMTMGMEQHSRYTLWRLEPGSEHTEKLELPETLVQYCHTPGRLFWITAGGEGFACGAALDPESMGKMSLERPDLLHISPDHQFMAIAHYQGGQTRIQIRENLCEEMNS